MSWIYLLIAVAFEVAGTAFLKLSVGLTRPGYIAAFVALYAVSFSSLALALKSIDLGVAYAIWCGLGIVATLAISSAVFAEPLTAGRVAAVALILSGTVWLQLQTKRGVPAPPVAGPQKLRP